MVYGSSYLVSLAAVSIYPIYGGIVLLAGLIVVCTELILEEIKSLKAEAKGTQENH